MTFTATSSVISHSDRDGHLEPEPDTFQDIVNGSDLIPDQGYPSDEASAPLSPMTSQSSLSNISASPLPSDHNFVY